MARVTCLRCGSDRTADGFLGTQENPLIPIFFRASKKEKWWHSPVTRDIRARLCADCGSVSLHADLTGLKVVRK